MIAPLTWGACDHCGGSLPRIDGDNDHPDLPPAEDCPGHSRSGYCGAYDPETLGTWLYDREHTTTETVTHRGTRLVRIVSPGPRGGRTVRWSPVYGPYRGERYRRAAEAARVSP